MSLYQAQLRERVGESAAARVDPILGKPVSATNPTLAEAAEFVAESNRPARQLIDVIQERFKMRAAESESSETRRPAFQLFALRRPTSKPLSIDNGWLVVDGKLVTGGRLRTGILAREHSARRSAGVRPGDHAVRAGSRRHRLHRRPRSSWPTRCVADGVAVFDHHYGLWYERRRDDHTMGRQADGNVAPPFYEQPFARTGAESETAWDGLSKYDLTQVQSLVLEPAARFRPALRRARPGAGAPELFPAQHSGGRRPLGRLPVAAGEQCERHRPARAAALHRRQAAVHGPRVLRRDESAAPRTPPRLHPPVPRQLRRHART